MGVCGWGDEEAASVFCPPRLSVVFRGLEFLQVLEFSRTRLEPASGFAI